jgi:hypothetical protein
MKPTLGIARSMNTQVPMAPGGSGCCAHGGYACCAFKQCVRSHPHHVVVWWQAHTCTHDVLQHGALLGQCIHDWGTVRHQGRLHTISSSAAAAMRHSMQVSQCCVLLQQIVMMPEGNTALRQQNTARSLCMRSRVQQEHGVMGHYLSAPWPHSCACCCLDK